MAHETPMTHDHTREEDRQAWPVPAQPRKTQPRDPRPDRNTGHAPSIHTRYDSAKGDRVHDREEPRDGCRLAFWRAACSSAP